MRCKAVVQESVARSLELWYDLYGIIVLEDTPLKTNDKYCSVSNLVNYPQIQMCSKKCVYFANEIYTFFEHI